MAALCTFRPACKGLLRSQATQSMYNNVLLLIDKANGSQLTHRHATYISLFKSSETFTYSTAISTSLRYVHSSSHLLARFQRPPALTPDDVDWSKMDSLNSPYKHSFDPDLVGRLLDNMDNDMPISEMPDPFEKNYRRCFICRNDVHLDHKNVRLLSQFVSPHTGRIYGRAITGLCIPMQKRVATLIKRARVSGLMPFIYKDPKYLHDPQPYDVMAKKF